MKTLCDFDLIKMYGRVNKNVVNTTLIKFNCNKRISAREYYILSLNISKDNTNVQTEIILSIMITTLMMMTMKMKMMIVIIIIREMVMQRSTGIK